MALDFEAEAAPELEAGQLAYEALVAAVYELPSDLLVQLVGSVQRGEDWRFVPLGLREVFARLEASLYDEE